MKGDYGITKVYKQYKAEGHTSKEVAEKFGISIDYVKHICAGIAPQLAIKPNDIRTVQERISKATNGQAEYISGYKNKESVVRIKCLRCGNETERTYHHITTAKFKCWNCWDIARQKDIAKKKAEADKKRILKNWKQSPTGKQLQFSVCKECGTVFIKKNGNQRYCSNACRRRSVNRCHDNRIGKHNTVDNDITLTKLYNRDSGRCYLCGIICDWNDKIVEDNGTVIVGMNYPTIEHVYPLSKGGLHAWHNVKLACKKCNDNKRDNIPPVASVS